MAENDRTPLQKFVKALQTIEPGHFIVVSNQKNGPDFNDSDTFEYTLERTGKVFVHVRQVGDFEGTPEQILAAVQAAVQAANA